MNVKNKSIINFTKKNIRRSVKFYKVKVYMKKESRKLKKLE